MFNVIFIYLLLLTPFSLHKDESTYKLKLINSAIIQELDKIYNEEINNYDWEQSVFVVKQEKKKSRIILKISIFYKSDFAWLLNEKEDKILGYFSFNENKVLVFGRDEAKLFSKADKKEKFNFLVPYKQNQKTVNGKPPIPIIFEPTVWVYNILGSNFIFKEKGALGILD